MAALRFLPCVSAHVASNSIVGGKDESLCACGVLTSFGSLVLASGKAGAANQSATCWLDRDRLLGRLLDLHGVDLPLLASPVARSRSIQSGLVDKSRKIIETFLTQAGTFQFCFGTDALYRWEIIHHALRKLPGKDAANLPPFYCISSI